MCISKTTQTWCLFSAVCFCFLICVSNMDLQKIYSFSLQFFICLEKTENKTFFVLVFLLLKNCGGKFVLFFFLPSVLPFLWKSRFSVFLFKDVYDSSHVCCHICVSPKFILMMVRER